MGRSYRPSTRHHHRSPADRTTTSMGSDSISQESSRNSGKRGEASENCGGSHSGTRPARQSSAYHSTGVNGHQLSDNRLGVREPAIPRDASHNGEPDV